MPGSHEGKICKTAFLDFIFPESKPLTFGEADNLIPRGIMSFWLEVLDIVWQLVMAMLCCLQYSTVQPLPTRQILSSSFAQTASLLAGSLLLQRSVLLNSSELGTRFLRCLWTQRSAYLCRSVPAVARPQKIAKNVCLHQFVPSGKHRNKGPCDVFDPWVRWERGQVGI